ncbi:dual specificity protein phosphatase 22-B isoform X1 [Echeneis naucrates]|uniref:dual specificity protein phosphatase 22-B isoform X1 n=1 Tax=Echeneis naucrates TaxID=173247 RepID=UPI0011133AB3|nr:dual specificity protein phosphatase 22 isoform X1 [Echeneis naucrates]
MGNGINKVLPDLYLGNIKVCRFFGSCRKQIISEGCSDYLRFVVGGDAPVWGCPWCKLRSKHFHKAMHETGNCWLSTTSPTSCPSTTQPHLFWRIQFFRDSIMFIHESRLKGEGCLVHCVAGVSRSVTLVVAYIMTVSGYGWVEALAAVRAVRPCAGPNLGFLRQLEEFENRDLAEYRAWWRDRYGKSSLKDDREIEALLTRKSSCSSRATEDSITLALATDGT